MMRFTSLWSAPALALAATLTLSAGAHAQTPDSNWASDAWEDALEAEEGVLTPVRFGRLNNLAFQAAVTRVCDGYALNADRFGKAVAELLVFAGDKPLTAEQQEERKASVLISLGTRYGLFIAEGNGKKDAFCAGAAEFKKDAGGAPLYWD